MTKKTIIVDEFHQGASAQAYRDGDAHVEARALAMIDKSLVGTC